ncbi:MAG TPA: complex I NDUFA9 subunit family protein [Sphingomicrobium sp.]|nr:complex I NDUFA9 subunit family protein [Sphingomicrobium sp.]
MINPSNQLATVFGGGGFIGRYVCEMLFRNDVRVRVASRNPGRAHFLQPLAQVGQLGFVHADITDPESVAGAVKGSTAVVNLCGVFGRAMQAVHVRGAGNVAAAARDAGAGALVHISAIGADPQSEADYGKTKSEGELAVRAAFPNATIVRPSLVFGPEDQLTNRLAGLGWLPVLPVIAPKRRFQPVFVRDLAQAIAKAVLDPKRFGGETYEIVGPQVVTMRELHVAIFAATGQNPELVDMPDAIASLLARFGWLPGAPLTRDQWRMLQRDNVAAEGAPGLEAFGIEPTPLSAVAHEWLGRFTTGGRFAGRRVNLTATS